MYDHLVTKVNAIDTKIPRTSELVTKTQYDSDNQSLLEKIKDVGKKTYIILVGWSGRRITKQEKDTLN